MIAQGAVRGPQVEGFRTSMRGNGQAEQPKMARSTLLHCVKLHCYSTLRHICSHEAQSKHRVAYGKSPPLFLFWCLLRNFWKL